MESFKKSTKRSQGLKNLHDLKEPQKAMNKIIVRENPLCTSPKSIKANANAKIKTTQTSVKKLDKKPSKNDIKQPFIGSATLTSLRLSQRSRGKRVL